MRFKTIIAGGHAPIDERFRLVSANFLDSEVKLREFEERITDIGNRVPISRSTVFPPAPAFPQFFVHNRQTLGLGDRLYLSMQKSTGVWVWVHTGISAT